MRHTKQEQQQSVGPRAVRLRPCARGPRAEMRWINGEIPCRVYSALYSTVGSRYMDACGLAVPPCGILPVTVKSRHSLSLSYYLPSLDQVFFFFFACQPLRGESYSESTTAYLVGSCLSCLSALRGGLCLY